jgi:hypothetical protein
MSGLDKVFLLSPAKAGGKRAQMLLNPSARFPLARRFQESGASIAEIFSFISGLYFRGKVAYAERFRSGDPSESCLVITPGCGILPMTQPISPNDLLEFSRFRVDVRDPDYVQALVGAAEKLAGRLAPDGRAVLLGSISTDKYLRPLTEVLGHRLVWPVCFAGCGDMRRGALMLRAADAGDEFVYERAQQDPGG